MNLLAFSSNEADPSDALTLHLSPELVSSSTTEILTSNNLQQVISPSIQPLNTNFKSLSIRTEASIYSDSFTSVPLHAENFQTIISASFSKERLTNSFESQYFSYSNTSKASTASITINSHEFTSYEHLLQITSSQSNLLTESELSQSSLNDNLQMSESNSLKLPSESFSDSYVWIEGKEAEAEAESLTSHLQSATMSASKWEDQISLDIFNIEYPLLDVLSSSMKQDSQQGSMHINSSKSYTQQVILGVNSISATEASLEYTRTSSVSSTISEITSISAVPDTTATPALHIGNILNFVSLLFCNYP